MDDLFEDFDDGMDDGFDDDWDDEPIFEDEPAESDEDSWDGPEWQDWMIIGPMSEEIAKEKREQDRIRKSFDKKNDEN
ncbi:hypothetical protein DSCO28_02790 [Desulfosarcina ovata subsp. sediminis]|uniref:Uncharacterized protein n=1 Tax=Desulfosarcina ovata subsp. sediminis TaxID=885957 RepID=A0A5K7ZQM1_9BACT|nr:hypothetical protein [Desulfosarcina ovata]BBO79713.1 hypothetical protein DSCO28_02790 [Desulfosarcina ovata subsp. sediminis]